MIKNLIGRKIILASGSPRRAIIFKKLGLNFSIVKSSIKEKIPESTKPDSFVTNMALKKVKNISKKIDNGLIVGADTVVVINGLILGKPKDISEAKRMLYLLSGNIHKVYTGIALFFKPENILKTDFEVTEVEFKKMDKIEIEEYIESKEPMDKAGAYGIQGIGSLFIKKVNGCFFNVMGFPISKFYDLYKQAQKEIVGAT
ncbi:septum formation protein Maf [candidate division KSB1 bacterium]|nr:MAG: septum formation protein Maf [candidate division KSB1 bacterium]